MGQCNVKVKMLIYLVLTLHLLLFVLKVSSSNVQYPLPSGILELGLSFQHRNWPSFLTAVIFHVSRDLSLVLLTFACIIANLDSILTDSDFVMSFFFVVLTMLLSTCFWPCLCETVAVKVLLHTVLH